MAFTDFYKRKRVSFLGTYPGLTTEMSAYEIGVIRDFVRSI